MDTKSSLGQKLGSHLVLLYDSETGENGSGVLVQFGGKIIVLTAEHIIFENLRINLGLPFHASPLTIIDRWTDQSLDIAFLELSPFEFKMYRADESVPFPVSRKRVTEIPIMKKTLALYGYPHNQRTMLDKRRGKYIPLLLACPILGATQWPEFIRSTKDPKKNFAIPYGPKYRGQFFDEQGKPMEISPGGMSGCGLWFYNPETEYSEKPDYALLGILHSHVKQEQVMLGTYAENVFEALLEHYGPIHEGSSPAAH